MPVVAFNKFNGFVLDLGKELHDFSNDVLKIALTNTAPLVTDTLLSNITEIAAGNGYAAGGSSISALGWAQVGGVAKLTGGNVIFTASGGAIGPFRYAVIYNSTPVTKPLICWGDYGAAVTLLDGQTFTVDLTTNVNIFTLQ